MFTLIPRSGFSLKSRRWGNLSGQRHDSEDRKAKRKINTVLLWLYNVLRHEGLTCSATSDVQEDIREANHVRPADVVPPRLTW